MTELNQEFTIRFMINFFSIALLCYGCYFRLNKNANVAGSFVLFGIGIFVITYLLHSADMSMEFAFGLFAVFTMLRYRTESISIKEMTYLFLVTAIALLTSVGRMDYSSLITLTLLLCIIAYLVDTRVMQGHFRQQRVSYERIENIKPQHRTQLIADLQERTGLNVIEVNILHIDFLKDMAELEVKYLPNEGVTFNQVDKLKVVK